MYVFTCFGIGYNSLQKLKSFAPYFFSWLQFLRYNFCIFSMVYNFFFVEYNSHIAIRQKEEVKKKIIAVTTYNSYMPIQTSPLNCCCPKQISVFCFIFFAVFKILLHLYRLLCTNAVFSMEKLANLRISNTSCHLIGR